MASESGFSNQKKLGISQFKTIHNVGGDKFGQSVASKALYEKTPEEAIVATDVIGNSGQIEFLNIYYPAHTALVNDVFRMTVGAYSNFEFDIISVIDIDNFLVLPLLPAIDISGDSGIIMGWVTNKANADGSQIVTLVPVPLQFVKDSVVVNVNEDTVTSANNSALPANNFFKLDGVDVPVSKDSAIPANTIALPVEDVNVLDAVNTLNLLVQNVDAGPGTSAGVPVLALDPSMNELKYLHVDSANALKVSAADLPLPTGAATETTVAAILADTTSLGLLAKLTDTQPVSIATMPTTPVTGTFFQATQPVSGPLTDAQLRAISVPVSVANFPATQPVSGSVGINNYPLTQAVSLSSIPLATGAATETKQAATLITQPHDQIVTTYVGATTKINTVVYKLATVTVATLTMSYDGSDRLIDVVRS
jgi:hypothetical protein